MRFPQEAIRAVTEFVFVSHSPQKGNILFVPGGPSLEPARKAAALYHEGFAPVLLPSGRFSKVDATTCGDYPTEWAAMAAELIRLKVPQSAVLKEDQATFTYENALYSKKTADRLGMKIERALLCCNPVHARRALMYYQSCFPETEILVCPCQSPITRDNWFKSKQGIQAVFQEISRIGAYQGELLNPFTKE